ncbi:Hypothetical protein, putative [Bodo saltans]|uniref:Uncharacterized protein n=1 Tax=Bodo saltans TaxID=75058 RepID=A0A0S4KKY7_BODSA|nr:Hypothetical protein, putative [Bodo saltans]|eukprot:CUI15269.1 Hypothetical protein, putative [Bodo saltans]
MILDRNLLPITKKIVEVTNNGTKIETTYTACYSKDVGRYIISPAMVVVLSTLMTGAFEENFLNIGESFEYEMAKFLYLAVQAFHGRLLRDLVDFIVGPLAVIGEAAQKILEYDTKIAFHSLTLRIAGSVHADTPEHTTKDFGLESGDRVRETKRDGELPTQKSEDAWIEMSSCGPGSANVVLHIPCVITLHIRCKDAASPLPAKVLDSILVEHKRGGVNRTPIELCDQQLHRIRTLADRRRTPSQTSVFKDYGQMLCNLGAPVIPVLYVSQACTLSSNVMSWDHVNAIGPHCIMAEGIGEHSLNIPSQLLDKTSPDAQYITARLHRVKKTIMLFESRQKVKVVDAAVTSAPHLDSKKGQHSSEQCAFHSERSHPVATEWLRRKRSW